MRLYKRYGIVLYSAVGAKPRSVKRNGGNIGSEKVRGEVGSLVAPRSLRRGTSSNGESANRGFEKRRRTWLPHATKPVIRGAAGLALRPEPGAGRSPIVAAIDPAR